MPKFPQDFSCFHGSEDVSDNVVQGMIDRMIDKMNARPEMSVLIEKTGNAEVIIFKQYRSDIDGMAYRILVMKNHHEYIVKIDTEEKIYLNQEEGESYNTCLIPSTTN